jgi:hypothetical protein
MASHDTTSRSIKNGWFSEVDSMLPGQKFSLALQVRFVDAFIFHQGNPPFAAH